MHRGSLTIVGTGYIGGAHLTPESAAHIDLADKLFYLGGDPATRMWLKERNPTSESLYDAYRVGGDRRLAYQAMVSRILDPVRQGLRVCTALYGHPGVFVNPSHAAIRIARAEGFEARMLPAISAEDCMFADLEVDPARQGCQTYEATDFVMHPPRLDPSSSLILWQVGAIGIATYERGALWGREGLGLLVETLRQHYPADHEVIVYEAAMFPVCDPVIRRVQLGRLHEAVVTVHSTLYVPPGVRRPPDPEVVRGLGIGEWVDVADPIPPRRAAGRRHNATRRTRDTPTGELTIVGTGYHGAGQVTPEAKGYLELADRVFYLLSDPFAAAYVRALKPSATSLGESYWQGRSGAEASAEMVQRMLETVRAGYRVTAAFSGHPAVFVSPSLSAVRQARAEGYPARILPAISVVDCLFADLGVDPAVGGCQLYEATDFLVRRRGVDTTAALILLQPGAVGTTEYREGLEGDRRGLAVLAKRLLDLYPAGQPVTLYETALLPTDEPRIETCPLGQLRAARPRVYSTLYVPPHGERAASEVARRRLAETWH